MFPGGLESIFGQKIKNSNFGPKVDRGGQKSIFCQKIESLIFRPKQAQKSALEASNQFLVEN